jgi:hypothetical protein
MARQATARKEPSGWMWAQTAKDRWVCTVIPKGETHAPTIRELSLNSDGTRSYAVMRNGRALGAPRSLELAKQRAFEGVIPQRLLDSEKRLQKYLNEGNRSADEFKKLTKEEQGAVANVYPWAMPRKSELDAKGVKVKGTVVRDDLLSTNEKKAVKAALPMDSKIERIRDGNPKKEGTDAWGRWEIMFSHDGQTVASYIKNHGNPTTLINACAKGWVKVKGIGNVKA